MAFMKSSGRKCSRRLLEMARKLQSALFGNDKNNPNIAMA